MAFGQFTCALACKCPERLPEHAISYPDLAPRTIDRVTQFQGASLGGRALPKLGMINDT